MVLYGEALSKLHREGATPDLLGHLRNHPLGQGMSETFRMISALNDPVIRIEDGIASLGHSAPYGPQIEASRGPKAGEYFATGLFLYLRMQENPKEFVEILRMAHQTKNQGFHPSIAASLFGAANGRSRLPVELLPDPAKIHSFLEKANAKE
jgi:hypothetical protein